MSYGWLNTQSIGGVYRDHPTGQRIDVSIEALYTFDSTIQKMIQSATAVHLKFMHSSINGTGGFFAYSGRVQSLNYKGTEAQPYAYSLSYYANRFSGF